MLSIPIPMHRSPVDEEEEDDDVEDDDEEDDDEDDEDDEEDFVTLTEIAREYEFDKGLVIALFILKE